MNKIITFSGLIFLAILSYWNARKIDSPPEIDMLVYERISGGKFPAQNIPDASQQIETMWQANLFRKTFFIIQMRDGK